MRSVKRLILRLMVAFTILPIKSFPQENLLGTKLSITFTNERIRNVVKRIERDTGISFAYANHADLNKRVTGNFEQQPVAIILDLIFENTNLTFKEIAGKITLYEVSKKEKKPQKATIHGYIYDQQSGERLVNANVYNPSSQEGVISNHFGFYSYSATIGKVQLIVSYMGYQSKIVEFELRSDSVINIPIDAKYDEIQEVTVVGNQNRQIENTQMSKVDMPLQKIKEVPVIFGEADVLKVIQLLPGVQAGVEGTSGIYVRGGGADQNLFLLDGVPVYNPGHLLGIFSVFNPEALKSVELYKGAFPARYGGRLSSVVDINMKDGNMQELKGDFTIGLIASKFTLEGPIKKGKTSFMISGRRSYADLLAQPFLAVLNKNDQRYKMNGLAFFHDLNFKLNHIFSDRSRLYWSFYHGRDKGKLSQVTTVRNDKSEIIEQLDDKFGLEWGNTISSVRWNYLISPRLFSNTTLTYSKYQFDIFSNDSYHQYYNNSIEKEYFGYDSGIDDIAAKIDFDYFPASRHTVKFGTSYINHNFTPGVTAFKFSNTENLTAASDTIFGNSNVYANEFSAYIEDDVTLTPDLKVNAGSHFSVFMVDGKTYFSPQARLSARWLVNPKWSLKAAYSRMAQYVHLLAMSGIDLPSDLWVPVTKNLAPPTSNQYTLGTALKLPHNLDLSVEGFYKDMNNLIEYKEGASYMKSGTDWENKVELGKGWSYGLEVLLDKTIGNTTGWVGYAWSKTERQFETINFGRKFPAKHDRRHYVSIVLTHKFSDRFDVSGSWVYGTGSAVTLAFSHIPIGDIPNASNGGLEDYVYAYESRNNYRMPDFHRLDLGVNFHKQKKRGLRTWNFSVYNAYNRNNAMLLMWAEEDMNGELSVGGGSMFESRAMKLYKATLMPLIPSVSYSYKF